MDRERLPRLLTWLERAAIRAVNPERIDALARALGDLDPPVMAGRWGTLIGYDPGPGRRRLVQFDRRGNLVAALRWRADGLLAWAKCLTMDGRWVGIEPAAASHPAWGSSDRVWLLDDDFEPWTPRDAITMFQSLDYGRPDFIPPLAEPERLPPGAGTAILNLVAGLMKDQGVIGARYRGPYPTEQLFTALLECFRYEPSTADPLGRFMDGAPVDWLPAPHESHHLAPGLSVQLRHEIDKVVLDGAAFYRMDWQDVARREPRVVRSDGGRFICSLWALGRPLEDRLILDHAGEVIEFPPVLNERAPAAPLAPVWTAALADLIARESAPALAASIREVTSALALEWGAVPGDLLHVDGHTIRISRRLKDAAAAGLVELPPGIERGRGAVQFILEVARLLGPLVRRRAQTRLLARSEDEQRRALLEGEREPPPALSESVGRLVALIASGAA